MSRSGPLFLEGEHSLSDILLIGEGCAVPQMAKSAPVCLSSSDPAPTEPVMVPQVSASADSSAQAYSTVEGSPLLNRWLSLANPENGLLLGLLERGVY